MSVLQNQLILTIILDLYWILESRFQKINEITENWGREAPLPFQIIYIFYRKQKVYGIDFPINILK